MSKENVTNINDTNSDAPIEGRRDENESEEDYDYTDDVDVEILKPTPKLPDAPPKLPDAFLPLDVDGSTSLSETLDTVYFSR